MDGREFVRINSTNNATVQVTRTPTIDEYADFISYFEGLRLEAYVDPQKSSSQKLYAIGYGTLLDNKTTLHNRLRILGLDRNKLISKEQKITKDQAQFLLREEIKDSIHHVKRLYPNFDTLPYTLKLILVDMSYNLGPKLNDFVNMRKAILQNDFVLVAHEMKDSLWYTQVGKRSKHHVREAYNLSKNQNTLYLSQR